MNRRMSTLFCLVLPGDSASAMRNSEIFTACLPDSASLHQLDGSMTALRTYVQVMDRMMSTLFCLVLPGDSASARRTSEIFMAGCIPVFLGPPYGSMPLAEEGGIDYKASSLFFNVTEYR